MLGSVCFRLSVRSRFSTCLTVALAQSHPSSVQSFSTQIIYRNPASAKLSRNLSRPRLSRSDQYPCAPNSEGCPLQLPSSPVRRFHCHSSSCLLAGNGVIGPTIWHALLPSRHLSIVERDFVSSFGTGSDALSDTHEFGSLPSRYSLTVFREDKGRAAAASSIAGRSFRPSLLSTAERCTMSASVSHERTGSMSRRFAMTAGLRDGSWNVASDVRPARWLHGRHSAWLLFGVCACFSAAAGAVVPNICTGPNAYAEPVGERLGSEHVDSGSGVVSAKASHGKKIYTDFSVTGIPGDGRCLFRAVAHGAHLRRGKPAPNESLQREFADELRKQVVDELVKRRDESEWFIEGAFDTYVKRMRQPHTWGGEPELLMASHVLKMPITVYMFERGSGGLISIAEYGQEYGKENPAPIRVLYHGFGHYDALQFPNNGTRPNS